MLARYGLGASTILAAAVAGAMARSSAASDLESQVMPAAKAAVAEKGAFGEFRTLLTGETRSLGDLLTGVAVIEPGQQIHPPHQHAEEEFLLLAKGSGQWSLDGKEYEAREGDLLYIAPWVMHGLKNSSAAPLTFFVVKWNGKGLPAPEKPKVSAASGANAPVPGVGGEAPSQVIHRDDVAPDAASRKIGDLRAYWSGVTTRSLRDLFVAFDVLNPGQQLHPPHQHAEEQFVYVTKGRGTWTLDHKELPAAEGDLLYVAPWVQHGLKNSGDAPLAFLVVKWNAAALEPPAPPPDIKK